MSDRDELDDLIDDLFDSPSEEQPQDTETKSETKIDTSSCVSDDGGSLSSPQDSVKSNECNENQTSEKSEENKKTTTEPEPQNVQPSEENQKTEKPATAPNDSKEQRTREQQKNKLSSSQPAGESPRTKSSEKLSKSTGAALSPRKKKLSGTKLLRDIRSFSASKLKRKGSSDRIARPVQTATDHKEAVLSTQQMAFRLVGRQDGNTEKRKKLHSLLVAADKCTDKKELATLECKIDDIREEITNNELLMGNFEHCIDAVHKDTQQDTFNDSAAFERYIEQERLENKARLKIPNKEPTVVLSVNVCSRCVL